MKKNIIYLVTATMMGSTSAEESTLPTIEVEAAKIVSATTSTLSGDTKPVADGGELLLQIPGISGVKMGSHGIDPVIRGQKQNQLNILLDGAYIYGGCPNRMDPPSSYVSTEIYDEVTVFKGVQTLVYGAGGSGGTVLFARSAPEFTEGEQVKGQYGAGYRSNGNAKDGFADISAGSNQRYIRGSVTLKEAENYQDGDSTDVRSGYSEQSGMLTLGARTESGTHYRLDMDAVRGKDILFAGAGMDAPVSDSDTYKLRVETGKTAVFESIKAEVYNAKVFHVMDNFSLRTNTGSWMRVPSDSITDGMNVTGNLSLGKDSLSIGVDYKNGARDATRYASATASYPTMTQSFLWPDVETAQTGLFAEYQGTISKQNRYTAGMRLDVVNAQASKATMASMMMPTSPDTLYSNYYGTTASKKTENNFSALYRMEHDISNRTMVFWGLSRTVRTADESERFMASNSSTAMMRWIGNPDIKPEVHAQLDIGFTVENKKSQYSVSVYYDDVSDYILRDRAHGQTGILLSDSASIYRNVSAQLYGFDAEVSYIWSERWQSNFTAAYVSATNTTDNRAIAQTPPAEGTASLEYRINKWMFGGLIRGVTEQTEVDDDATTGSGLDFGKTPGFMLLNLYASMALGKDGNLMFGIDNVFDKTYAEHLNKPNAFDPSPIRVNEPGRSVWGRVSMKF